MYVDDVRVSMHPIYAHTKPNTPQSQWEMLYGELGHAQSVCNYIKSFDNPFRIDIRDQMERIMEMLALYHDMGKASHRFQEYLRCGGSSVRVDHKSAAAKWIMKKWNRGYGCLLAYCFMGHHSGLGNGSEFFYHSSFETPIEEEVLEALPENMRDILPEPGFSFVGRSVKTKEEAIHTLMMYVRMLHSCLVDADWLATEAFVNPETAKARDGVTYMSISDMSCRLEQYLEAREEESGGRINDLRKKIHRACQHAASKTPGVFQLNVPTGGGKTLSSLSFALEHARRNGLKRVIYVIPYTSIIEQTAQEFRRVFGDNSVLEHHSNLAEENDSEFNRFAAENWDAPLIITTNIQFFESLYSCRNKKCRKLHNIANSVIILDEAQTLPTAYLKPCLFTLKSLQRDFGCSIVLCTATQPMVVNEGKFDIGWQESEVQSLIGSSLEARLALEMKRVEVVNLGTLSQVELIEHFLYQETQSALFIVNLTRQAQDLFSELKKKISTPVFHLSARMCPAHRLNVLNEVRARLREGKPTILVATRVVEAGVDISFPIVYRDQCGLDSLAQSAGRCNRHGERDLGTVYFYTEDKVKLPSSFVDLRDGIYTMADIMNQVSPTEIFAPETVNSYFKQFYTRRGFSLTNMDTGRCEWDKKHIISDNLNMRDIRAWNFKKIAEDFRLIDTDQKMILVPYGELNNELRLNVNVKGSVGIKFDREMFRFIAKHSVGVQVGEWEKLRPYCECINDDADIWSLCDNSLYDKNSGLCRVDSGKIDYVF